MDASNLGPRGMWSQYDFTKIPFKRIVRVGQRSLLYRDLFCVSWILGRFCNYHCSYCWPYASSKTRDHRPTHLILSTVDEIKRQARERGFNSFHFSFSGGEPTSHPGYLDILQHYVRDAKPCNYQSVHMTSNCSPGLKWFEKYVKTTRTLNRVSVTASFHKEFAEPKKFRDKLIFLQENEVQVTINMVMGPERFEELWEDALFFHESGINVTLKPQSNKNATCIVEGYSSEQMNRLRQGMPQRDYTAKRLEERKKSFKRPKAQWVPNQLTKKTGGLPKDLVLPVMQIELTDDENKSWYMDQAERFNAFEFNKFKGWECSSGFRSIVIREPDGYIKRSYSCHDKPLGHIERGFKLFDQPQPCQTPSCVSSADSKIPKRRAGTKLPLWPLDRSMEG